MTRRPYGGSASTAVRALFTACALVCILLAAGCVRAGGLQPIRLMSYNIAAGKGDLTRIAETIRAADADVVALQEVDVNWSERSNFEDQAARLAALLDMHVRFAPIYTVASAADSAAVAVRPRMFGLAVLSRHPIVEFRNHIIPRLSTQSADSVPQPMPGFPEAVVDIRGVRIHVFNTHLDYRADPRVRVAQVRAMLPLIRDRAGPVVLMGDLNAPPDAPELQPLVEQLRDSWTAAGDRGLTYPADAPARRIDYILLSSHFTVRGSRVADTTASDHRPVIADVLLN